MRRTVLWMLAIAGALLGGAAVLWPTRTAQAFRHGRHRLTQRIRYARGRINGTWYRLARRTPDPTVADDVLADRVRSSLGRLEKRLDTPRIHVLVEDHVVFLHGDVPSSADAVAIDTRCKRSQASVASSSTFTSASQTGAPAPRWGARRTTRPPPIHCASSSAPRTTPRSHGSGTVGAPGRARHLR
jgi:hypothetical protein